LTLSSGETTTTILGGPNQLPVGYGTDCLYDNEYRNAAGKCKWCDVTCFSCSGAGPNECTACVRYWYLLNGTCYQECPDGYVKNDDIGTCVSVWRKKEWNKYL